MKSHILRIDLAGTNTSGEATYSAKCARGCWSGTMTAKDARSKQDEHVQEVSGPEAQEVRERDGLSGRI